MKTVKINKDRLLETVKLNLETHVQDYKEAVEGYAIEMTTQLKAKLAELDNGEVPEQNFVDLPKPSSHAGDYEQVIAMLEYSEDDVVELDDYEFQNYVMDNWGWKERFSTMSSNYKMSR